MTDRSIYIWKLDSVINAEGGVGRVVDKAAQAKLSALWVKVADGQSPFANVLGPMTAALTQLVTRAHDSGIQVWGWQVPHCPDVTSAQAEATTFGGIADKFKLDGLIMDAEGTAAFFHGGIPEARAYGAAMRKIATDQGKPLGISSNDIPQNITGWLPRFNEIAKLADWNFPQTYYGASASVASRVDRAANANSHLTVPFAPVGAGFLGVSEGGCASAQACGERAATFIQLCKDRGYQRYSFWHWAGAPMSLWDVLNSTAP